MMPFSFTFNLSVPGLSNPFTNTASSAQVPPTPSLGSIDKQGRQKISRRRPSPVHNSPSKALASRKRGWEPTFAEPSLSSATYTSTGGYLDTPAKYRDMVGNQADELNLHDVEMIDSIEMPPPAKRRRGLAGSIVSTALSAALIGTAVGLTVYRLWRDRGKEPEQQLPPPPYQQGEWTPTPEPAPLRITPATPRSRKQPTASTSRRTTHRRTVRPRGHLHQTPPRATSPPSFFPQPQPEFNFGHEPIDADTSAVENQMDWIGDKLSMLIEEGKKALGREVVVMSDAKEDEFDDGNGAWEEEDPRPTSLSRASSMKRNTKRPRSLAPPHHSSPYLPLPFTPSPSPRMHGFDIPASSSMPIMISPHSTFSRSRGMSVESGLMTPSTSFREDEHAWESPELRESMERARARLLRNRGS